jgi:hypothetical protein
MAQGDLFLRPCMKRREPGAFLPQESKKCNTIVQTEKGTDVPRFFQTLQYTNGMFGLQMDLSIYVVREPPDHRNSCLSRYLLKVSHRPQDDGLAMWFFTYFICYRELIPV